MNRNAHGAPPCDISKSDQWLLKKVGYRIKVSREKIGLDLHEFSLSSGIEINDISLIEEGIYDPSLNELGSIASTLKISVADLVDFST